MLLLVNAVGHAVLPWLSRTRLLVAARRRHQSAAPNALCRAAVAQAPSRSGHPVPDKRHASDASSKARWDRLASFLGGARPPSRNLSVDDAILSADTLSRPDSGLEVRPTGPPTRASSSPRSTVSGSVAWAPYAAAPASTEHADATWASHGAPTYTQVRSGPRAALEWRLAHRGTV